MAEVVTRGKGEVERTADRAQVWVTFSATAADRKLAVKKLADQVTEVERLLVDERFEVRSRGLSVSAAWEDGKQIGSQADQQYQIRVAANGALEELLNGLIAAEPAHVNGPNWELSDPGDAVQDAQYLAVSDARRRAEGYATALGTQLGNLLRISDGDGTSAIAPRAYAMGAASAQSFDAPDTTNLNLEPEQITVSAECTAVWSLIG
ncbi:DUF541 domain-containing protein [Pseudonocardiaceae bacterium YIM PH 21723]|nr:DUF541 domain-containing protein [Pseudonocardiaceae bacterium YIM PH 21723]